MAQTHFSSRRRRGAAAVEMAAVASVFLLFLFGILEYGRLIMTRQVAEYAVREGARYAVTHTQDETVLTDTEDRVRRSLAGLEGQLEGLTIQVYHADHDGNALGDPSDAQFGEYIAVQIDGVYRPLLPSLLFMGNEIPIRMRSMMYSEAN